MMPTTDSSLHILSVMDIPPPTPNPCHLHHHYPLTTTKVGEHPSMCLFMDPGENFVGNTDPDVGCLDWGARASFIP